MLVAAVAGACAAVPAGAGAAGHTVYDSKYLWATVDVCDTPKHPNAIGIRGSMPGSGVAKERMFLRIQVQYRSRTDGRWHNIAKGADSAWLPLGSGRYRARQAGADFAFVPPAGGRGVRLRGAVTFEWRIGAKVVRHARVRTTSGHVAAAGADPAGFSAASCVIR
jgi:hypothetical protein